MNMKSASEASAKKYDRMGAGYDTVTKIADKSVLDRMRRGLVEKAQGRVLDVGVGTGKNFDYYEHATSVVGIDLSSKSLETAREKARHKGITHELRVGDVTNLEFADGSFDTVVMCLVACNLDDPIKAFREMRRVCKKDGYILFLEHTPPTTVAMNMLFGAVYPIARLALNCRPFSKNVSLIPDAGLREVTRETAAQGVLNAIVTQP